MRVLERLSTSLLVMHNATFATRLPVLVMTAGKPFTVEADRISLRPFYIPTFVAGDRAPHGDERSGNFPLHAGSRVHVLP